MKFLLALLFAAGLFACSTPTQSGAPSSDGEAGMGTLGPKTPTFTVTSFTPDGISLTEFGGTLRLRIENPNTFPLPLGKVSYALRLLDEEVQSGTLTPKTVLVPAGASTEIAFPLAFRLDSLASVLQKAATLTEIPYALQADAAIGPITVPIDSKGKLPKPIPPSTSLERLRVVHTGLEETEMGVGLRIVNRNAFPLRLGDFVGSVSIGSNAGAAFTTKASFDEVAANSASAVELPFRIRTSALGAGALGLFGGGGVKAVRVEGTFTRASFLSGESARTDAFTKVAELPVRP